MKKGLGRALLVGTICAFGGNVSPAAAAPIDGAFGQTSQGSVLITASVPGRVKLTKLSDVNFSNVDPTADVSRAQDVCVWSNTASRKYTIAAEGSGLAKAFTLGAGGDVVPYSVEWAQSSGQTSGAALTTGTVKSDQASSAVLQDCGGGTSASLIVRIASTALQGMTASTPYTGTLTLLVSAQ